MTNDNLDPDQLRELAALTGALPRDIPPPPDAWTAIRAGIASREHPVRIAVWQRPAFLVAASLLLVAGSSAITALMIDRDGEGAQSVVTSHANASTASASGPATLAQFTVVENDYISTANRLSAILESDEVQLAPSTVAKLKESLRVIDGAILEARAALASDPANPQLIEMLSTTYQQKVDLLKRTTEMGRS